MAIYEPCPDPNRIVASHFLRDAPTGEATVYVTAAGELWREVYATTAHTHVDTGTRSGRKIGNRIYPW